MIGKPCTREGCERPRWGSKLCASHVAQLKRATRGAVRAASKPKLPAVGRGGRDDLYTAQGGMCPHCGRTMAREGAHVHHRKLRSHGGTNDPANLLLLPGGCHADVHAHPNRSKALGHIVAEWDDPATVAVLPVSAWRGEQA